MRNRQYLDREARYETAEIPPVSARYDTKERENTLSWNKIGKLDCLGENLEFASIPQSGECHGR